MPAPARNTAVALASPAQAALLQTAATLAELLQRVDASSQAIGAAQYQKLVRHLASLMQALDGTPALATLLDTFPSAATVYENARYAHAGLCRAPLQASLQSELQASQVIGRARRATAAG